VATAGSEQQARARLGGRGRSLAGAGKLVQVPGRSKTPEAGVVLFVDPDCVNVWLGDGRVLKTTRAEPLNAPTPPNLSGIAAAAARFAALGEGQRVAFRADSGGEISGTLQEKCRYGALVLRDDGRLLAVGFRRVWGKNQANVPSH
jgi:hypothetical protein